MSAFPQGLDLKEKPRLLEWTGLELDSVKPLKSPVSPSAPIPNVAFGSTPCLICGLGYFGVLERLRRPSRLPPLLGYWKPRHVRGFLCSRTVVCRPFATSALRGRVQPQRDLARAVAF